MTNLADHLLRHAIGYDGLVRSAALVNGSSFPPYNIEQVGDDEYRLTLAVAGYSKEDISITEHNRVLTIKGTGPSGDKTTDYIHQGIAFRDFQREWRLGDHFEVAAASMVNGLLVVKLIRNVPDEEKPKLISIA